MARPRVVGRTRSSVELDRSGEQRVETINAWRRAISRHGSALERGETLRPHPWSESGSKILLKGSEPDVSTRVYRDPTGNEPPSLGAADAHLAEQLRPCGCEPSYDKDELARLVGPAYVPHCCIGIGGMAEVWLAEQVALHRPVAVKVLPPDTKRSQRGRDFHAEALISSHLSHPNILPVYDAGDNHIVMKFVEGKSLAERMHELGDFDLDHLPELIEALIKVSDAMAFAHGRGVVHCDLKPQNVMLGEWGEVLVMDWGLALCTGSVHDEYLRAMIRQGETRCAGTPGYMAPEMARRQPVDQRCDVFLLGAMLYEVLTGEPPFEADSPLASVVRSVDNEYRPVLERQELAPERLVNLQEAAMHGDPAERMGAKAFSDGLRTWLGSSRNEIIAHQALEEARLVLARVRGYNARRHWDQLYRCYRDALALIERSLNLVPEGREAAALRTQTMAAFKIAAVSAGELFLARLLAGGELPPQGSGRLPVL